MNNNYRGYNMRSNGFIHLFILISVSFAMFSQDFRATLTGRVIDAAGAAVPNEIGRASCRERV